MPQKMSLKNFSVVSWFSNMLYGMAKNEYLETLDINRKLPKSKKHPVFNSLNTVTRKLLKSNQFIHLGFNNQKNHFHTIIVNAIIDNFEQHLRVVS